MESRSAGLSEPFNYAIISAMSDTIFHKIVSGEIPNHTIYEDDDVLAFLDTYPTTEGYTVIIPKKPADYVWDMDDEMYEKIMHVAKRVAQKIRDTYSPKFVGLKVEGTHVQYAHVKVFQFEDGSDYNATPDMSVEPNHTELARVAEALKLD